MQTLSVDQLVGQNTGKYRIERMLGRGQLNTVYLARDLVQQNTVALTTFVIPERFSAEAHHRFIQRFHKEAATLAKLDHPHVLPIYEAGELDGNPYLVTPYMTNGSLADLLKREGRCSPESVLEILEQVVAGLEYAHSKGVLHATLRPSNILLGDQQTWLVAGFGLMRLLQMRGIMQDNRPYAHLMSIADTLLVAPEHVAPEIVQGQEIDVRSDVYAVGSILFELLSGKPPFTGTNPLDVIKQHVEKPVPSLRALCPDIPIALVSVVNQALERNLARRFQHVGEIVEAFTQVYGGPANNTQRKVLSPSTTSRRDEKKISQTPSTPAYPIIKVAESASEAVRWPQPSAPLQELPRTQSSRPMSVPPVANVARSTTSEAPWWLNASSPRQELPRVQAPGTEPLRRGTTPASQRPGSNRRSQSSTKTNRRMSRRQVVTLIAAGSVVAAGAVVAINLTHVFQQGTLNTAVIPTNSAVSFTNHAGNASLLVHLSNGNFVAYDKACTHSGVYLNYNPATQKFVCPAHGAIFDPAHGGAVLREPTGGQNTKPLPKVAIRIDGNGNITAV